MEKINAYEEYMSVIRKVFSGKRFYTNNLMPAQEIKEKIENGQVYCIEEEWGAWILVDEETYYTAAIYLICGKGFRKPEGVKKPIITELVGTRTKYCEELENVFCEMGFQPHARNLEMTSGVNDMEKAFRAAESGKKFFSRHGFVFHKMSELKEETFIKVWKIWLDTIDNFAIRTFTPEEYQRMVRNDRGVFVTDSSGEVAGAGCYSKEGVISYAHHIAVSKRYNGIGLGGVIMNECASKAFQSGTEKYVIWIADDNEESISMQKSISVFTGKYSKQFILQGEEEK